MKQNVQIKCESRTIRFDVHLLVQVETSNGLNRWFEFLTTMEDLKNQLGSSKKSCKADTEFMKQAGADLIQIASNLNKQSGIELQTAALKYLCCFDVLSTIYEAQKNDSIWLAARISKPSIEIASLYSGGYKDLRNTLITTSPIVNSNLKCHTK